MSFSTPEQRDHMRGMSWQDRTPPPKDPARTADLEGRNVYNKSTGYTLFHQSVMPVGHYRSVIMERVPAALLLYFAAYEDNRRNPRFAPVCDYVERHREEIEARAARENRPIDWHNDFRPKF